MKKYERGIGLEKSWSISKSYSKELNLNDIESFINNWFLKKWFTDIESKNLLNEIIKNKNKLLTQLLFFHTSSNVHNSWCLSQKYFFKLFFDFLEKETFLSTKNIKSIKLAYFNKLKEKFANSVSDILSKKTKIEIWIDNLKKIEEKVENIEQSKILLNFLEKNPEYIESTVFLILWLSDIKKVIELITKIINYNNIIKLTDDKFQFKRTKDDTIKSLNILDIHYTIHLIENTIVLNDLILIINNINVNYIIKMLNILWPYEVTNLINITPNIIDFINYINSHDIDIIIEEISKKWIIDFLKSI